MGKLTFQTIPEVLTYGLLIVMLCLNVVGVLISLDQQQTVAENSKIRTQQIKSVKDDVAALKAEIYCMAKFFDQPNRGELTITEVCKST